MLGGTLHGGPNAVQAYDKYLSLAGQILEEDTPSDWVLAHLWVARALARQGDAQQSVRGREEDD